jgi:hypothetical protein
VEHKGPTGEWWIANGKVIHAARNTDLGLPGHTEAVMTYVGTLLLAAVKPRSRLATLLPILEDVLVAPNPAELRTALIDWSDFAQRSKILTDDEADDVYTFLQEEIGWSKEQLAILTDHWDTGDDREKDPRFYAVKQFNWIRIEGPTIEMWELTDANLRELRRLEEQQTIVPEDRFTLTVRGGVETFFGLPWLILQEGRVVAIKQYVRQFGDTIRISV